MTKKIIRVAKGWPISYCDPEGNTHEVNLTTNKEYRISINNGTMVYPIITVDHVQKGPTGHDEIVPKLQIDLGYWDPIKKATCGNIPVLQIDSIEEVRTGYISERRTKKDMDVKGKEAFTFAFDRADGGEYRISVYSGEMMAFSVRDDRPETNGKTRNIYGVFRDFDEKTNELVITRYMAGNGVRQLSDFRIHIDILRSIFRYAVVEKSEEDLKAEAEAKKDRRKEAKKRAKAEAAANNSDAEVTMAPAEE